MSWVPCQFEEEKRRKAAEERIKFPLEQKLKEHIIGQEGAITTVASGQRFQESDNEKKNKNKLQLGNCFG